MLGLIDNYMKDSGDSKSNDIVKEMILVLSSHQSTSDSSTVMDIGGDDETSLIREASSVQDIITVLGPSLTSADDKLRYRSTTLISQIFQQSSVLQFTAPVLHLFVVFFSRRLSDYPSIVPSLQALTSIIKLHHSSLDPRFFDISDVYQNIFGELKVPSYPQNVRYLVLILIQELLHTSNCDQTTIKGIMGCCEGEKDPRCLLLALQVINEATCLIISKYSFLDDTTISLVFDGVACYFPITFTPPPDDPYGITPESLTTALLNCLTGNKFILNLSVPFFISQLDRTDGMVQSDNINHALLSIQEVIAKHGHKVLNVIAEESNESLLLTITERLINIICANDPSSHQSPQNIELSLALITSISRSIIVIAVNDWIQFSTPIFRHIDSYLLDDKIGGIQTKNAMTMAYAMSKAGILACKSTLSHLLPQIIDSATRMRENVFNYLNRSLLSAHKGINILPSMLARDAINAAPLEILSQLLSCWEFKNDESVTHQSIDTSQLGCLDPFRLFGNEIIELINQFISPLPQVIAINNNSNGNDSIAVEDNSEILDHNHSHSHSHNGDCCGKNHANSDCNDIKSDNLNNQINHKKLFQITPEISSVIAESMHVISILFSRLNDLNGLDVIILQSYITRITRLVIFGLPTLYLEENQDILYSEQLKSSDKMVIEVGKSLLVALSSQSNQIFDDLLRKYCLSVLVDIIHSYNMDNSNKFDNNNSNNNNNNNSDTGTHSSVPIVIENVYQLLTGIVRKSKGITLLSEILSHFLTQNLSIISNLLQTEPKLTQPLKLTLLSSSTIEIPSEDIIDVSFQQINNPISLVSPPKTQHIVDDKIMFQNNSISDLFIIQYGPSQTIAIIVNKINQSHPIKDYLLYSIINIFIEKYLLWDNMITNNINISNSIILCQLFVLSLKALIMRPNLTLPTFNENNSDGSIAKKLQYILNNNKYFLNQTNIQSWQDVYITILLSILTTFTSHDNNNNNNNNHNNNINNNNNNNYYNNNNEIIENWDIELILATRLKLIPDISTHMLLSPQFARGLSSIFFQQKIMNQLLLPLLSYCKSMKFTTTNNSNNSDNNNNNNNSSPVIAYADTHHSSFLMDSIGANVALNIIFVGLPLQLISESIIQDMSLVIIRIISFSSQFQKNNKNPNNRLQLLLGLCLTSIERILRVNHDDLKAYLSQIIGLLVE
eukprot:gene14225-19088_t